MTIDLDNTSVERVAEDLLNHFLDREIDQLVDILQPDREEELRRKTREIESLCSDIDKAEDDLRKIEGDLEKEKETLRAVVEAVNAAIAPFKLEVTKPV